MRERAEGDVSARVLRPEVAASESRSAVCVREGRADEVLGVGLGRGGWDGCRFRSIAAEAGQLLRVNIRSKRDAAA